MQLMMTIKSQFLAVALVAMSLSGLVSASVSNPVAGKEYQVLAQPQTTDSPGKVEVIEFFFYSCPHCNRLDPVITAWAKKQGNAIAFKRVHVNFGQGQQALQRMYFTLEKMGQLERLHPLIFDAFHKEHQFLRTDQDMLNFVTKNGVDKNKYQEISKSFFIESQLRRAQLMQDAYRVEDVPRLYVDGQYLTSPGQIMTANSVSEATAIQELPQVLDALVAKVQKDKKLKK